MRRHFRIGGSSILVPRRTYLKIGMPVISTRPCMSLRSAPQGEPSKKFSSCCLFPTYTRVHRSQVRTDYEKLTAAEIQGYVDRSEASGCVARCNRARKRVAVIAADAEAWNLFFLSLAYKRAAFSVVQPAPPHFTFDRCDATSLPARRPTGAEMEEEDGGRRVCSLALSSSPASSAPHGAQWMQRKSKGFNRR